MVNKNSNDNSTGGNNVVFALIILVVIVAIAGSVLLRLLKPEAEATFINTITQMFGFLLTIVGLLYVKKSTDDKLSNQDDDISTIKSNTNGTLSAKESEIKAMRANMLKHGINPDTGEPVTRRESLETEGV